METITLMCPDAAHVGTELFHADKVGKLKDIAVLATVPCKLRMLQDALAALDAICNTELALQTEADGWEMNPPLPTVRFWVALLALYAGKALDCLIMHFAKVLKTTTDALKIASPAWSECFSSES